MDDATRARVEADVRDAFDTYERAIQANEAEELVSLFWDDPGTVRAAPNGFLVGARQIAEFRRRRPAGDYRRRSLQVLITALSEDVAIAAMEWQRQETVGYQTQTWLRTADGWRVAMGHVSTIPPGGPTDGQPEPATAIDNRKSQP